MCVCVSPGPMFESYIRFLTLWKNSRVGCAVLLNVVSGNFTTSRDGRSDYYIRFVFKDKTGAVTLLNWDIPF